MTGVEEYFDIKIREDLSSSRMIQNIARPQDPIDNKNGKYWIALNRCIIGVADWRPRAGTFETPWNAVSSLEFAPPPLAYTPDSFEDIATCRALELIAEAKNTNRKLLVLWSGGIDSTFVLTSFIKNMEPQDRELVIVCCNFTSIFENTQFYIDHISGKFKCLPYQQFDLTPDLLSKYIIIHGDPGDCIQGPSLPAYADFIANGTHKEPWQNHVDAIAKHIQPHTSHPYYEEGFGKWFTHKVCDNLEEVAPENVKSVSDWWWWTYYNFKWEFSCQRAFFFSRKDHTTEFTTDQIKDFAKNTYFNTADWQHWSYTNLDKLIGNKRSSHKKFARDYIYELDRNDTYYATKVKTAGAPADIQSRRTKDVPFYYDQNWTGYHWSDTAVMEIATKLLERFQ
jgi:hypothetical protein